VNLLDDRIIDALRGQYGRDAWVRTVPLKYHSVRFFYRTKDLVATDRMGEVVFAVERPNGKFITVRSKEYPEGIFRVPTGGIKHGEDIVGAVKREVSEELGLVAEIVRFIGVYRIELKRGKDRVYFYSFFFHLKEISGNLLADASDDEVDEVMEADANDLENLSERLKSIDKDWKDWGLFRYLTTKAICDYSNEIRSKKD
jgi:8-oxo-dGTP diphosphatase